MRKATLCVSAAALAALLVPSAAEAACRSGPPPGRYSQDDDEGLTLDLSPITRNPLFGAVGGAIAEVTRGVTNIRQIVNLTECPVSIRKVDGGSTERKDIEPGGTLSTNFWVPWADDAQTYADHHMIISVDGVPEGLAGVESGELTATVAQYPYAIGEMGAQACAAAVAGDDLPENVEAPVALVTKDNVADALEAAPAPFEDYENPFAK